MLKGKEESSMQEKNSDRKAEIEMLDFEISIYTDDCGEIQFHCLNDCLGGSAWLSIEH